MEPIQLPKPATISVPDIPQTQPRQMIYSLHSKPESYYAAEATNNYPSGYDSAQKVVMPVRLPTTPGAAADQQYYDDGYRQTYPQPNSRDNSRRSSYTPSYQDGNGSNEYNRIDAFSYDAQQDPVSPRSYMQSMTPPPTAHSQQSPYYNQDHNNNYNNTNTSYVSQPPMDYSPNPMHGHTHSSPPPVGYSAPVANKVQRIGASSGSSVSSHSTHNNNNNNNGYNSGTTSYATTSTTNSNNGNRHSIPPRPQSPDAKKNDRLRTLVLASTFYTKTD